MEIFVSNVSKEEIRILMRPLAIESLRAPLLADHKLEKKYITGFRANNVTYLQLVQLYYQEIHSMNTEVENTLKAALYSYIKECNLEDFIEQISDDLSWEDSVKLGIQLGESGCEIGLELLLKITSKKIPDEKKELLIRLQENGTKRKVVQEELIANYEEKVKELANLVEKLKKEVSSADGRKEQALSKKKELETEVLQLKAEKKKTESEIETLSVELTEVRRDLDKKSKELQQTEKSLSLQNDKVKERETTIVELQNAINDVKKKYKALEEQKMVRYDEAIIRLVADTIEDLREEYDIDIKEFESILAKVSGEQSITNVWHHISSVNEQLIEEVEVELRQNKNNMEIIDKCNEVENLILAKYVMVKAIKSLHFEYMSCLEKNESMFGELRK